MKEYKDKKSGNPKNKIKQSPHGETRKNPKPGYDEKNPTDKKDIQQHPENQNTG